MPRPSYCCKYCEFNKGKYCSHNNTEVFDPWSLTNICEDFELVGNERYLDLTYFMRIVERFLDTGECEILPDVDVLEGYLRNAMNSPVIKVLALSSEVGGKIFETNIRKFLYRIDGIDRQNRNRCTYNVFAVLRKPRMSVAFNLFITAV